MGVELPSDAVAFRALFIKRREKRHDAALTRVWEKTFVNALLRRRYDQRTHRCCDRS
jgi:hypothetical protein